MTLDIILKNRDDVESLNHEARRFGDTLFVHTKDDAIMVDARSLLALYSLIGKEARLVGEDNLDPKEFIRVAKRAGLIS